MPHNLAYMFRMVLTVTFSLVIWSLIRIDDMIDKSQISFFCLLIDYFKDVWFVLNLIPKVKI